MPRHITNRLISKYNGYTINKPGYYHFCEDIIFCAQLDNSITITINSNNVVLNMKHYTLTQNSPNVKLATGI